MADNLVLSHALRTPIRVIFLFLNKLNNLRRSVPVQVRASANRQRGRPGRLAGSGVACRRAAGRSALRQKLELNGARAPLDLTRGHPSLNAFLETRRRRIEADRSSSAPRPTTHHQATPLPAESWVQRSCPPNRRPPIILTRMEARTEKTPAPQAQAGFDFHLRFTIYDLRKLYTPPELHDARASERSHHSKTIRIHLWINMLFAVTMSETHTKSGIRMLRPQGFRLGAVDSAPSASQSLSSGSSSAVFSRSGRRAAVLASAWRRRQRAISA